MMEGILLAEEYVNSLRQMSKADLGDLMMAILDTEAGEEPDLEDSSALVKILYPILHASITRVRGVSEQNSENGKKGGRPAKKTEKAAVSEEKSGAFENEKPIPYHTIPNDTIPYHDDMPGKTGPTVQEVKDYADEEGLVIDAERFVAYYDAKDWKTGTDPIKDWKKVARKWAVTERKEPAKPPDKPKKTGKYAAWLESKDYSELVNGRRA